MRYVGLLVLAACAEATTAQPAGSIDAPVTPIDSAKLIDAAPDAPVSLCTSSATCAAAMDLGTVSGDTGADMKTASGYQSAWYRLRVTENDSSVIGVALRLTARLTSPAGTNYDLYLYVNEGSDVIECTTVRGSGNSTGTMDSVSISWGEGTVANGVDDSRSVSIEVRPVSGPCSASQPFQLVLLGNQ